MTLSILKNNSSKSLFFIHLKQFKNRAHLQPFFVQKQICINPQQHKNSIFVSLHPSLSHKRHANAHINICYIKMEFAEGIPDAQRFGMRTWYDNWFTNGNLKIRIHLILQVLGNFHKIKRTTGNFIKITRSAPVVTAKP